MIIEGRGLHISVHQQGEFVTYRSPLYRPVASYGVTSSFFTCTRTLRSKNDTEDKSAISGDDQFDYEESADDCF